MTIVDAIIILTLLCGAVLGFKKGAIRSLVTLIGTLLLIVISFYLKNPVASLLMKICPFFKFGGSAAGLVTLNVLLYEAIAYILVFVILSSILSIIIKFSSIIEKILNATIILGIPSKIIGAVLGFIEAIVFSFIVLFVLLQFNMTSKMISDSSIARSIIHKTPLIGAMVNDTYEAIKDINKLQEKYKDTNDIDMYNGEILAILLNYEIVTPSDAEKLIDSKKLDFNGASTIVNNYKSGIKK